MEGRRRCRNPCLARIQCASIRMRQGKVLRAFRPLGIRSFQTSHPAAHPGTLAVGGPTMQILLKHRCLWATAILMGIVTAGYLLVPVQESRISQANCDRIQAGWSRIQVKSALGEPDGEGFLAD